MKTKHIVLTQFLVTSVVLTLGMLTSNAWAEETGPEARQSARNASRRSTRGARGTSG